VLAPSVLVALPQISLRLTALTVDVAARHRLRRCRAYQAGGQRLSRITPGPERDLRWQERLTRTLLRARPVDEDPVLDDPGHDWPGIFEELLGAPVVLRSYGPTAADKRSASDAFLGRAGGIGGRRQ
jgi:adenylosuccinate synthase